MAKDNHKDLSDLSMLELFRMEVENQTAILNQGLLELEHVKNAQEMLENMMRAAHSIKGAARMVNVDAIVQLAHAIEDCFVAVQKKHLELSDKDIDTLLAGVDMIQQISHVDDGQIETWGEENNTEFQYMETALKGIHPENKATTQEKTSSVSKVDSKEDDYADPLQVFPESNLPSQTTIRIGVDRLDKFLSLAGKSLVETHQLSALMPAFWQTKHKHQLIISEVSRLQEALSEGINPEQLKEHVKDILVDLNALRHQFAENVAQLDAIDRRTSTISDHLHREIMSSRMRPISEIISGLPRMVRDLGRRLNKEVRLRMSGISTLVDRHVLERIDTPIKHLVQNAIDHGIELPKEREKLGKTSVATITISVSMSAGMLFVVIEDDGRGIDFDLLKKSIVNKGLAKKKDLENLIEGELLNYLFYPGFTTRENVSDISGRGVGLDLVKDAVVGLNGSVHAAAIQDKGMKFQVVLPLTVSVLRVMLATIHGESYAFPMSSIDRMVYAGKEEVVEHNDRIYLKLDGEQIPLVHANEVFGTNLPKHLPPQLAVIVLESNDNRYGVVVEKIDGEQEVSIHKLSSELGKIRGINAAAILNNGALSLIVEIDEFVSVVDGLLKSSGKIHLCQEENIQMCELIHALVVDDSLTVREMEKKLISKLHYRVSVAEDGMEALEVLSDRHIDIIVTDIDMPNMNGIQLINELRFQQTYEDIPIIIVSNREKSFLEQSVVLNDKTVYLAKDQFTAKEFLSMVQKLAKSTVTISEIE